MSNNDSQMLAQVKSTSVGITVGASDGFVVVVGNVVGCIDTDGICEIVGRDDGIIVGTAIGKKEISSHGPVGAKVGRSIGSLEGDEIGISEGINCSDNDGIDVGPSILLQLPTPNLIAVIVTLL